MITTTQMPPLLSMCLNPDLLSMPIFRHDAEELRKIADWLEKKIICNEFKKHPTKRILLMVKHAKEFMELYERAKIQEREAKEKTFVKANAPFYRPRFANRNDQRLFERLDERRNAFSHLRKNISLSKV